MIHVHFPFAGIHLLLLRWGPGTNSTDAWSQLADDEHYLRMVGVSKNAIFFTVHVLSKVLFSQDLNSHQHLIEHLV